MLLGLDNAGVNGGGGIEGVLPLYTWDQLVDWKGDGEDTVETIPVGQHDCEKTATNRLWKHLELTESWPKLVKYFGAVFCLLEKLLLQVENERYVSTAYGVQLDMIGEAIGLDRNGASDARYRELIKVEVQTLYSSGTIGQILDAAAGIITDGRAIELFEFDEAAFLLTIPNLTAVEFAVLKKIMCDMPAAGVSALLGVTTGGEPGWDYQDPPTTDVLYEAGWAYSSGTDEVQAHWSYAVSFGDCGCC